MGSRADYPKELREKDAKLCVRHFDRGYFYWAMENLPIAEAVKHFLLCGTVGSGKTTNIQLFLQSIAPRFQEGFDHAEQLIVFDAKGDMVQRLAALGLSDDDSNFYILNPFDTRAAVLNFGKIISTPALARYFAALIIPEEKRSNAPYFSNAARDILCWVIIALQQSRKAEGWTLRDLLCACESKININGIAKRHPARATAMIERYTSDDKHIHSVLSHMATRLGVLEEVAALWHTAKSGKEFSIKNFLKKRGVLVLGFDPVLNESLWPINAIILQALTNEILRSSETQPGEPPRHWFVLDEFRAMERLQCITNLMNRGRSKGASVLLGIQSIEGIIEVYGEQAANDILGLCTTKTFLRAGGPITAEWAERHFNKVRYLERSTGYSGSGYSYQDHVQDRPLFLASTFLNLPMPFRGGPYSCISDVPCFGESLLTERPFDVLLDLCASPVETGENYLREDADEQILTSWGPDEEEDFCRGKKKEPKTVVTPDSLPDKEQHNNRRTS